VNVPSTIEDREAVNVARERVREYFKVKGKDLHKATEARAKL
jgi:propionyl-CoA synthetase